jgi:DNA-binding NarL/FixJ family response regulator
MSQPKRVLIADDQRSTRRGLHALLDFIPGVEWVGEAGDGSAAVEMVVQCRPDVVLMDARMPVMDGMEATRRIKRRMPGVKVVLLSMYLEYQSEALAAGADTFLLKGGSTVALQAAICDA